MEATHHISIDGGCIQNPGPGGWACIVFDSDNNRIDERSGSVTGTTTNNQMELYACIVALRYARKNPSNMIRIYSDSKYVVDGINEWSIKWRKKDFGGVKNSELWRVACDLHDHVKDQVELVWVKGHAGHYLNEQADQLANAEARRATELNTK